MKVKLKKKIWEFVNDVNDFLTKSDNSFWLLEEYITKF